MRLDSFELSKIAGGFLCALLVIVGFRVALEIHEHGKPAEKPGFVLPMPEAAPAAGHGTDQAPAGGAAAPAAAAFDAAAVAQAAASGNAQAGAGNLQEVHGLSFGRERRAEQGRPQPRRRRRPPQGEPRGFNYSDAMKAKGGNWTLEDLASFVHSPKTFVPGTKMLFPGIADPGDLSDLLAYLNTLK